jgi:hypothetical protein
LHDFSLIGWTIREGGAEPVRIEREIMPDCVLNQVRALYPNIPGIEYMNHQWW